MSAHPSIREVCHHRDCYLKIDELGYCSIHLQLGTLKLLDAIRSMETAS